MKSSFGKSPEPAKKQPQTSNFLPFITNSSSPASIFKTLLQRTKGMSNQDLILLYSATLFLGVDKIKHKVSTLSAGLTTKQVFKELITFYPQFKMSKYKQEFWKHILKCHGKDLLTISADFTDEEKTIMFACIAEHSNKHLKELNFDVDIEKLLKFSSSSYKPAIAELENISFNQEHQRIGFFKKEEFDAFVAYKYATDYKISFCPVLLSKGSEAIHECYENKECSNPYTGLEGDEYDLVPF